MWDAVFLCPGNVIRNVYHFHKMYFYDPFLWITKQLHVVCLIDTKQYILYNSLSFRIDEINEKRV